MTFEEILAQVRELLAREGRVAYRIQATIRIGRSGSGSQGRPDRC